MFLEACGERLTKYLAELQADGDVPAPLDYISLHNGVLKFLHDQVLYTDDDWSFCMGELEKEFGAVMDLGVPITTEAEIIRNIRYDSAAGYPYCYSCDTQKGPVVEKLGLRQLILDALTNAVIIGLSEKDELRPRGKDARLFRPAPLCHVVLGIVLFGRQATALAERPSATVSAIGIGVPGIAVTEMWNRIMCKKWVISGDGARFDASFPLEIARIIAVQRYRHLIQQYGQTITLHLDDGDLQVNVEEAVRCYYAGAYNGVTNVGGVPVNLIGNPSGHYLTSDDNTRCEFLGVRLAMRQLGVPRELVELKVMGDDYIIGSNFPIGKRSLIEVGEQFGFHWELLADGVNPVFIGTEPVRLLDYPYDYGFAFDPRKVLISLLYRDKRSSEQDFFMKCCSICSLIYHTEWYPEVHEAIARLFAKTTLTEEVSGSYASISPYSLNRLYLGSEAVIFSASEPESGAQGCGFTNYSKSCGSPFKENGGQYSC